MFSRCYATLSDLVLDLTGLHVPLPIFSYGFCLALGFIAAAFTLAIELRRKENLGLLKPYKKSVTTGEPATPAQLILNAVIGFILGFKLTLIFTDYSRFASDPQGVLLSGEGSLLGGLIGAALLAGLKYYEKSKQKLDKPKTEVIEVHPHQAVGDITIVAAISGIIGAKIFYFFESPGNFQAFLEDPFGSFFGGLTVFGGLILGTICVTWYVMKKGMNPIHIADAAAPGLFLAYVFGRQGCQISGDGDWGIVNTLDKPGWLSWLPDRLWAFNYPHNIIDEGIRIPGCTEAHCSVLPEMVFPTPMYESFMTLVLFLVLWSLRKKIHIPGIMISLYFILAGIERFFIEKIRVNTVLDFGGIEMTQAELISIFYVLIGIGGMIFFWKRYKKQNQGQKAN